MNWVFNIEKNLSFTSGIQPSISFTQKRKFGGEEIHST